MTTTKYPKFRKKIAELSPEEMRNYALAIVNKYCESIACLSASDLPDTAVVCNTVDEMESIMISYKTQEFTDADILSLHNMAKDAVVAMLEDEGFPFGE